MTTTHAAPQRRTIPSRPPSTLQLLRETLSQEAASAQPAPVSASPHSEGGSGSGFSTRQIALLSAPLDRANVRQREQGRSRVSYLEGWQVIAEANRIFGFDGWERSTLISPAALLNTKGLWGVIAKAAGASLTSPGCGSPSPPATAP